MSTGTPWSIPFWRVVAIAVAVEALAIVALVTVVALFGPSEPAAAQEYALNTGTWFGPLAGLLLCTVGGWLAASRLDAHQIVTGFALGAAVALIDAALLAAAGAPFEMLFVASNAGKVLAGGLGGFFAGR